MTDPVVLMWLHVGLVQVGLQGVDNGAMRFTNLRIPRDNLLDRFATVDRGGKYSSPYSPSRRFAATLGELTGGRVGLTCGSLGVLKVLLPSCCISSRFKLVDTRPIELQLQLGMCRGNEMLSGYDLDPVSHILSSLQGAVCWGIAMEGFDK